MSTLALQRSENQLTLVEIIRRTPQAISIFEDVGIDYACRGMMPLRRAAADAGVTADEILKRIAELKASTARPSFESDSLTTLVRYLTVDHERLVSTHAQQIRQTIEVVVCRYPSNDTFKHVAQLWDSLTAVIETQAQAEEREVFPLITAMDRFARGATVAPVWRISPLVLRDHREHQGICSLLSMVRERCDRRPREVTSALAAQLADFRADLHFHMHLENNVLYPRALELENQLREGSRQNARAQTKVGQEQSSTPG